VVQHGHWIKVVWLTTEHITGYLPPLFILDAEYCLIDGRRPFTRRDVVEVIVAVERL